MSLHWVRFCLQSRVLLLNACVCGATLYWDCFRFAWLDFEPNLSSNKNLSVLPCLVYFEVLTMDGYCDCLPRYGRRNNKVQDSGSPNSASGAGTSEPTDEPKVTNA